MKSLTRTRILSAAAGLLLLPLLSSCTRDSLPPRPMPPLPGAIEIGKSVEERPIHELVLGEGSDVVLILATIHGNENAGTPLMHHLVNRLQTQPSLLEGKKVVIVPVVNPDGYAKNIRYNAHGIDLNRNFDTSNRQNTARYGTSKLSEPESTIIYNLLNRYKPARIVTMHQPLDCMDWDGPGKPLAEHMGRFCYLPVRRVGARPGSLGSYAGEDLQLPIITFELPREAERMGYNELWSRYGRALLASITYPEDPPEALGETSATKQSLLLGFGALAVVMGLWLVTAGRSKRLDSDLPE